MDDVLRTKPAVTQMDFLAMEASARRVLIAQDVLDLLKHEMITARRGRYVDKHIGYRDPPQLHQVFEAWLDGVQQGDMPCFVCALGATFMATVRRFNDFATASVEGYVLRGEGSQLRRYLSRFFSKQQLDLIETAFEGLIVDCDAASENPEAFDRAARMLPREDRERYKEVPELAKRIFTNIVKNNGEFIP